MHIYRFQTHNKVKTSQHFSYFNTKLNRFNLAKSPPSAWIGDFRHHLLVNKCSSQEFG